MTYVARAVYVLSVQSTFVAQGVALSNWTVHDMCACTVDLVGHVLIVLGCKNELHTWRPQRYATLSTPPTQSEHSMPFRAVPFRVILQCWGQTVDGACNNTSEIKASQASAFAPFSEEPTEVYV